MCSYVFVTLHQKLKKNKKKLVKTSKFLSTHRKSSLNVTSVLFSIENTLLLPLLLSTFQRTYRILNFFFNTNIWNFVYDVREVTDLENNLTAISRINPNAAVNFNMDGLKEMLKCASCHRFLFPPILQCINGHMECRNCFDLKPQCGKCSQKMVEIPAKFAEMITEQFNVQCSYAEKGCTESVAFKVRWELKGRPLWRRWKKAKISFSDIILHFSSKTITQP